MLDYNKLYRNIIKKAVEAVADFQIEVKRCDEIPRSGWIHETMIREIATADIAIVDITGLNPNVFFELGVRHSLKKGLTILVQLDQANQRIPFNIAGMSVVKYAADDDAAAIEQIHQMLSANLAREDHVDSLVFKTLPDLRVEPFRPKQEMQRVFHSYAMPTEEGTSKVGRSRARASAPGKRTIGVVTGDISHVTDIDVWVSSENTEMMMARYHERAISAVIRYWGAERDESGHVIQDLIQEELTRKLRQRNSVPAGHVVATGAGALQESHGVGWIFHAASVIGQVGGGYKPIADVNACIDNALRLAECDESLKLDTVSSSRKPPTSILFPIFGTGQAKSSLDDAILGLVRTVRRHFEVSPGSRIQQVYFISPTVEGTEVCNRVFERLEFKPIGTSGSLPRLG
ncbi:MAG: macro domain-containing protein [Pseudomonadota bacterium]